MTTLDSGSISSRPNHAITFFPGIINKLHVVFKSHDIDIIYSNSGKLSDVLGNPKDKCNSLEKSGVYKTVASHVLDHTHEPINNQTVSIDSLSILRDLVN
jgi:hypothetical protein